MPSGAGLLGGAAPRVLDWSVRHRLLFGGGSAAILAVGVTGAAASVAVSAGEALERARDRLAVVQQAQTSTDEALRALREADREVEEASRLLDSWTVDVIAAIPLLGRSWAAQRAVTWTAEEVLTGALLLAEDLPAVSASPAGVDLAALAELRGAVAGPAERSQAALEDLERAPVRLTPGQVSRGVSDARDALAPAVQALQAAEQGLDLMSGILGGSGSRSLLIMLQNNAELRGAGGYAASFATGRTEDGRVTIDAIQDVVGVADLPEQARRVPAPEEYVEDYGPLSGDTTMWRSWNMSPHVPDSALVGARVAGQLLPRQPDVVVLLDVPALGALAGLGGGAIALPNGSSVSPEELTDALLVDAYAKAGEDDEAQRRRRADLRAAATSAVGRLLGGTLPTAELARSVARLAAQRHIAIWSAVPREQAALEDLGLAGSVEAPRGGDLFHVSVNNIGSNKLDYYVDRDLQLDVEVGTDKAAVRQRVTFRNEAPSGLVPYVAGVERPGTLVSRVELSLPPAAADIVATVDGLPWRGSLHTGGERHRISNHLQLAPGRSSTLELRYTVPVRRGRYVVRLIPQPLVEDAGLRLSVRAASGQRLGHVAGGTARGGQIREEGTLGAVREVSVDLREKPSKSAWQRLKDWWTSPVVLG